MIIRPSLSHMLPPPSQHVSLLHSPHNLHEPAFLSPSLSLLSALCPPLLICPSSPQVSARSIHTWCIFSSIALCLFCLLSRFCPLLSKRRHHLRTFAARFSIYVLSIRVFFSSCHFLSSLVSVLCVSIPLCLSTPSVLIRFCIAVPHHVLRAHQHSGPLSTALWKHVNA